MMSFVDQIDGSTPNACWKEIYCRIKEKQCNAASELEGNVCQRSGSDMFGFSNPQIRQLIQVFKQIAFMVFTLHFISITFVRQCSGARQLIHL